MLDTLFSYLHKIHPLTKESEEFLKECMQIQKLPAKTLLLEPGKVCNQIVVVLEGCMRMYYNKDGEEICSRFMHKGNMAMSVISFYRRTPSYEYIESITPVTIATIQYEDLQKLYAKVPSFNAVGRMVTEEYFIKSEERLFMLRKQKAKDRYLSFTNTFPELVPIVPLKHIASYLGISQETLSRIRAEKSL